MRLCLFTALLFFTISACTRWQAEYLEEVKGRANQDDIAQRLGAPTNTHKLNKGGEVWTYEVCSAGGTGCVYYVLTFDEQQTLRNWQRND